jgi:hypothetical protein
MATNAWAATVVAAAASAGTTAAATALAATTALCLGASFSHRPAQVKDNHDHNRRDTEQQMRLLLLLIGCLNALPLLLWWRLQPLLPGLFGKTSHADHVS